MFVSCLSLNTGLLKDFFHLATVNFVDLLLEVLAVENVVHVWTLLIHVLFYMIYVSGMNINEGSRLKMAWKLIDFVKCYIFCIAIVHCDIHDPRL